MKRNSHVWFCSRDGIQKQPSTITPKEPNFVNNTEEERKESLIEGIIYVSVNMLFGHLNPLGSHQDK